MIYEVEGLRYTYPGADRPTLDECGLTLAEGEVLSILGLNGAGKSTLLSCLCGLLRPQAGRIRLCGEPLAQLSPRRIAGLVGYVQQKWDAGFDFTALDVVMMGLAADYGLLHGPKRKDEKLAWNALERLGITGLAEKPFSEMSGGEQQQVAIARAIVHEPKVLLFDEPTAHLDYGKQLVALRLIRRMVDEGYGVIMTTHNPDHVLLLGGRAAMLGRDGRLEAGAWQEIVTEPSLQALYQTPLHIRDLPELERSACIAPNLKKECMPLGTKHGFGT